jgi:hypothetical protein
MKMLTGVWRRLCRRDGNRDPEEAVAKVLESRTALSERYLQELTELISNREISAELAARIRQDMFEERAPGEHPQLRLAYWQAYLKERTGDTGLRLVKPSINRSGDGPANRE